MSINYDFGSLNPMRRAYINCIATMTPDEIQSAFTEALGKPKLLVHTGRGGGKSTLAQRMADELREQGYRVVEATTEELRERQKKTWDKIRLNAHYPVFAEPFAVSYDEAFATAIADAGRKDLVGIMNVNPWIINTQTKQED